MALVTFDGANKIIDVNFGETSLDAQIDLYSDWKEWVLETGSANARYLQAFRTTAGDPIGPGKFIAPYFFLLNGWVIRPHDADHELLVEGNLYADPFANPLFIPTSGSFTVAVLLERAVDAISTVVVGTGSLTTEQAQQLSDTYGATGITTSSLEDVLTSQSLADADLGEIITSQSLADTKLDALLSVSGSGLTPEQANWLLKVYEILGLDPTQPLVVTPVARTVSSSISQSITTSGDEVTVTRTV